MVTNKAKKVTKYRAHTTHGGGHRKKRRGAGSRGGRGNAGSGKRAGQKVAGIKESRLGRTGFKPRRDAKAIKTVAVGYFTSDRIEKLLKSEKVTKEGDFVLLDLKKLGYDKLLATGSIKNKLKIKVSQFSARAAEKVKAAGGEIISEEASVEEPAEVKTEES